MGYEDTLFLGRRGRELTRQMVFTMLRRTAHEAGIRKQVLAVPVSKYADLANQWFQPLTHLSDWDGKDNNFARNYAN